MPYFPSVKSGGGIEIKEWTGNFGNTQGNTLNYLTDENPVTVIGARAYNKQNVRWENVPISTASSANLAHVEAFTNAFRLFIDSANGLNHFGGQEIKIYYIQ